MASNLEVREAEDSYDRLQDAVLAYISECDNPVPHWPHARIAIAALVLTLFALGFMPG